MPRIPYSESIQVILVGDFNPAVFHPEWFLRHDLIGEQDVAAAEIRVVSPNGTDAKFAGLQVACTKERFIVETLDISWSPKAYDLVTGVLVKLANISYRACGINPRADYQVQNQDYWHKIGHTLAPKEQVWNQIYENPGMETVSIKVQRKGEYPGETNITVQPSTEINPGLYVRVNEHYPVPSGSNESAQNILNYLKLTWDKASKEARRVAETIFEKIPE